MWHLIYWMNRGDLLIKSLQSRLMHTFPKQTLKTVKIQVLEITACCLSVIPYFLFTTALPSWSNRSGIKADTTLSYCVSYKHMPDNFVAMFEPEQGQELLPQHLIKCLQILDPVHSLKLLIEQLKYSLIFVVWLKALLKSGSVSFDKCLFLLA